MKTVVRSPESGVSQKMHDADRGTLEILKEIMRRNYSDALGTYDLDGIAKDVIDTVSIGSQNLDKKRQPIVYAFVDGENLYRGVKSQRWNLDYKKLRLYLKNKYGVARAFIFMGYIESEERLYNYLRRANFEMVFKPTVKKVEKGKETYKGNVDAELVLWAAACEFANYDRAVIISSDGDFRCLYEFLTERNKLLKIIVPNKRYSRLIQKFRAQILEISLIRKKVENPLKKSRNLRVNSRKTDTTKKQRTKNQPSMKTGGVPHQRSVETLGLSRHGDTRNSLAKLRAPVKDPSRKASKKTKFPLDAGKSRTTSVDLQERHSKSNLPNQALSHRKSSRNSGTKNPKKSQTEAVK